MLQAKSAQAAEVVEVLQKEKRLLQQSLCELEGKKLAAERLAHKQEMVALKQEIQNLQRKNVEICHQVCPAAFLCHHSGCKPFARVQCFIDASIQACVVTLIGDCRRMQRWHHVQRQRKTLWGGGNWNLLTDCT